MSNFWILFTGVCVALSAGSLGCFLILQKKIMLADAISHAVLPGIVIAFLLSGTRSPVWMLLGASLSGLFTVYLVDWLERKVGLQSDSSIGVTYTWLFALGIILLAVFANKTDIDQECVLFGELIYVPLAKMNIGGFNIPEASIRLFLLLIAVILFIILCYRSLVLHSFDPKFAAIKGAATVFMQYAFLGMISTTTVFSFESVGVVLVIALLVIPPVSARVWVSNIKSMLFVSAFYSIASVILGFIMAYLFDGTLGATITICSMFLFLLSFFLKQIFVRKQSKKLFSFAVESDKVRVA